MVSSTNDQPTLIDEEEISRLRKVRISVRKASLLIGRSYPSTRTLIANRHLITLEVGKGKMVTLWEVRRFLQHGNATPKDWAEYESNLA